MEILFIQFSDDALISISIFTFVVQGKQHLCIDDLFFCNIMN